MKRAFVVVIICFIAMCWIQDIENARKKNNFSWLEEKKSPKRKKLQLPSSQSPPQSGVVAKSIFSCADDPACLEELRKAREMIKESGLDITRVVQDSY